MSIPSMSKWSGDSNNGNELPTNKFTTTIHNSTRRCIHPGQIGCLCVLFVTELIIAGSRVENVTHYKNNFNGTLYILYTKTCMYVYIYTNPSTITGDTPVSNLWTRSV